MFINHTDGQLLNFHSFRFNFIFILKQLIDTLLRSHLVWRLRCFHDIGNISEVVIVQGIQHCSTDVVFVLLESLDEGIAFLFGLISVYVDKSVLPYLIFFIC